jgi:hypothetical protein
VIVILGFRKTGITLADRKDRITPSNAKKSDVRRVLRVAQQHETELRQLWEKVHGKFIDG